MIKVLILQTGKDYFQGVHLVKKLKCFFSFLFFFFFFYQNRLRNRCPRSL